MHNFTDADKLKSITITEEDILRYIDRLKPMKSPGPDKIYATALKEAKLSIVKPLTLILNESVAHGEVPIKFKLTNVTPIFKKGKKKLLHT